jgi:hypothetical protein
MSSKLTDEEILQKCRRTSCCVGCDFFRNNKCIHHSLIARNTESARAYVNPNY